MVERYKTPPLTKTNSAAVVTASTLLRLIDSITVEQTEAQAQKLRVPSPLRPHTTMAIEKVKAAARAAQPTVISIVVRQAFS